MISQLIAPEASTSRVTDNNVFTNVEGESTDKDAEKQTINNKKKKKGIGLVTGWLRIVEPRKVPYFPQKRDKIVYLRQAHECYLKEVVERKIFDVTESDKLWVQMKIDVFEYLIVTNITFEKHPTRVACLEVRRLNEEEQAIGPVFRLKYHDMGDVVDFLVLKHIFNEGLQMKWNVGDRFRCLVGNKWFFGTIKSNEPFEKEYPKSPFKSFQIKWDDERELDEVSPWELESVYKNRLPKNHGEYVEVLNIEIVRMRYKPCPDDWPIWKDWRAAIKNIISEFDLLMSLPISKCFIEIKNDPIYDALVLYPIDLSTIKERLKNYFYRRSDSLLMDIYYLEDNARMHKPNKFYEEAKRIAKVCKDIISEGECSSSFSNLKEFLENFNSSESDDDDNEYKPSGSNNRKGRQINCKNNWKMGCKQLLDTLWDSEDMFAFRQSVCREDYPDYYENISSPICLEEIKTKFNSKKYESPKEMLDDIKLIITNSRSYNKDKEKAIYHATTRVSALFEELKKQIHCKKESPRKKFKKSNQKKNEYGVKPKEKKFTSPKENGDEKGIDSKNNNYKTDLSEALTAQNNDTNIAVVSSSLTKEKSSENSNEVDRMETVEDDNTANSRKNSEFDNIYKDCEIIENDSVNQSNMETKSTQISQSQRRDSSDNSIIVIDSDNEDEQEHQNVTMNFEKPGDLTQSQLHNTENTDVHVNAPLQEKSNFKKSLASIRARKRMQLRYNRIFQTRPRKLCGICKSIKKIYLEHVRIHHS